MSIHARIPGRKTLKQADRSPISTYDQACWRLVALREDPEMTDAAYDFAVKLIADIYWRTDNVVRRDVRVLAKQVA